MLRITAHDTPRVVTLRLEGRLEGAWAEELEKCWKNTLASLSKPKLRVDLTSVTSIDAAGRARLAAMHRKGAEFIASDCLMKAVVEEITKEIRPNE
jgi:anti-anti-sigma regulatory factor